MMKGNVYIVFIPVAYYPSKGRWYIRELFFNSLHNGIMVMIVGWLIAFVDDDEYLTSSVICHYAIPLDCSK